MTVDLLGKLRKVFGGTGGIADAVDIEVDATGYTAGNLDTSDVNLQLIADALNGLTIPTPLTLEQVRDAVAAFVRAGDDIAITHNDDNDTLTFTVNVDSLPGSSITLDTSNFATNLDSNVVNVQLLADAVDDLVGGGTGLSSTIIAWLNQTAQQTIQSTSVTNIAPSVTDVLIWRRAALVQQANVGDSGTGVRLDEGNRQSDGTFDRPSGTSTHNDDLANAYIYVGITNSQIDTLTLSETFLEARRNGVLVYSSSLSDLVQDPLAVSQLKYFRTTNTEYNYVAGDVLTVVTRSTSDTTEYNYNAPVGDFTANIRNLPFTAVDEGFQGRVNGPSDNVDITANDIARLAGLLVSSSSATSQPLTVSYKEGEPSGDPDDYTGTWNAANPVLANFGATRVISILVDSNVTVTSITGGATLGAALLWIPRKKIYRVVLPAEAGGATATSHAPIGTIDTLTPTGFSSNYKIVRNNVEATLLAIIDQHGTNADLTTLTNKVATLYALATYVNTLVEWGSIYNPARTSQTVTLTRGVRLVADYRASDNRYESAGVTYGTGTNVITYSGLSEDLHKTIGLKVSGPSDKVLMWIDDGVSPIPYIQMIAAGKYQINNYVEATTPGHAVTNEAHFLTRTAGQEFVRDNDVDLSTFTLTNFPSGSTARSRTLQVDVDVAQGTVDTLAGHFVSIDLPEANTAQAKQEVEMSVNLGPLYGNRHVDLTIGYELRVVGADLVVDFTLETAPSGIRVRFDDVATVLNYTSQSTTTRTDRWLTFQDAGGDYTFTGASEIILSTQAIIPSSGVYAGLLRVVPVVRDSSGTIHQLNDRTVHQPTPLWDKVQAPDDIEFRIFTSDHYYIHSDLVGFIRRAAIKWAYGNALLEEISTHAVTEAIDLAAGSTINGAAINGNLPPNVVYQSTGTGTSSGELVANVTLPATYTNYDFVHVTEMATGTPNEWRHTVIATALLSSGHVTTNDYLRVQGNTDLGWNGATRVLNSIGGGQSIYSVILLDG